MSGFFQGFEDEAGSWNVPNPVEWMTTGSSFSSKLPNKDETLQMDQEASSTPTQQARQEDDAVVEDVGMVRDEERTAHAADDDDSSLQAERDIFQKAREYLRPSRFFRFWIQLYAQRKMTVFFLVHFFATMVVWAHFALIKFEQQAEAVPVGAHRYWLKRLAPPLEFGESTALVRKERCDCIFFGH